MPTVPLGKNFQVQTGNYAFQDFSHVHMTHLSHLHSIEYNLCLKFISKSLDFEESMQAMNVSAHFLLQFCLP